MRQPTDEIRSLVLGVRRIESLLESGSGVWIALSTEDQNLILKSLKRSDTAVWKSADLVGSAKRIAKQKEKAING